MQLAFLIVGLLYRKTSNTRRVSNKRRGYLPIVRINAGSPLNAKVTNVLIGISIQLFTQLISTQFLLLLLSHAGIPLNAGGYLPIVRVNAGSPAFPLNAGVFVDCSNKRPRRLLEVLRFQFLVLAVIMR